MRKMYKVGIVALGLSAALSFTAFAGQWKQYTRGWWYVNDDGSYPANSWQWIDGNKDGISECYYFNPDGCMLANTTTPDGYTVNGDGAWVVDSVVQTQGSPQQPASDNTSPAVLIEIGEKIDFDTDPLYIKMKESAFAKLATITDFNQDEITLELPDIVYEGKKDYFDPRIDHLLDEIYDYCITKNRRFNTVGFDNVVSGDEKDNKWSPVFRIIAESYDNDPLYVKTKNSALAQLAKITDFSQDKITLELTDVVYDGNKMPRRDVINQVKRDIRYYCEDMGRKPSYVDYSYQMAGGLFGNTWSPVFTVVFQ